MDFHAVRAGLWVLLVAAVGNIAIATVLLPSSFVYCIVNIKQFVEFLYHSFHARLRLQFIDMETNHSIMFMLSAEYSVVMYGA